MAETKTMQFDMMGEYQNPNPTCSRLIVRKIIRQAIWAETQYKELKRERDAARAAVAALEGKSGTLISVPKSGDVCGGKIAEGFLIQTNPEG